MFHVKRSLEKRSIPPVEPGGAETDGLPPTVRSEASEGTEGMFHVKHSSGVGHNSAR